MSKSHFKSMDYFEDPNILIEQLSHFFFLSNSNYSQNQPILAVPSTLRVLAYSHANFAENH